MAYVKSCAESPPAKIVNLLEVLIGTLEKGNMLFHPHPGFSIWNMVYDILPLQVNKKRSPN